jgi:predicted transcriptional regulator
MRFLADIPDDDVKWLDLLAQEQGKSRAAILREAVASYRGSVSRDWLERGFGLWKGRADIGDSAEFQRRERAAWTRPWDDDYEAVKAEFPDLFDAEDDRQREIQLAMRASGKHGDERKRA